MPVGNNRNSPGSCERAASYYINIRPSKNKNGEGREECFYCAQQLRRDGNPHPRPNY